MREILVVNGPNLNLLGEREPERYGRASLAEIEARLTTRAAARGAAVRCFQSNHEGALVDWVQAHANAKTGLVLNAGALTHGSIALRDAILARRAPFVEVHVTNVYAREPFRHVSYFSDVARGVVAGLGDFGYDCALDYLLGLEE